MKKSEAGVCPTCRKRLPVVSEPLCKHCGKPVASAEQELCKDCEVRRSHIEQGTAIWLYDDQMRKAIADYKYEGCLTDGDFYARELISHRGYQIRKWAVDAIIPVPLHKKKQRFRGFNQAAYLAEKIGEELDIPVYEDALIRRRNTAPQKGLGNKERRDNLKRAFEMNEHYQSEISASRSILLVDDIYTTGATLEACAGVLKKHGDARIYFACLCIGRDY